MKKSFLATPKKLLLATSILAMSSTAIAADRMGESEVFKTLTVSANYVKTLALNLNTSTINFGDVFTGATVDLVDVVATVTGDAGETFTYLIETSGTNVTLAPTTGNTDTAALEGSKIAITETTGTALQFSVGLNTTGLESAVSNETVTVTISYDAIAATRVDDAADA